MARRIALTNAQSVDLSEVHPGFTGRWMIQVTAYAGLDSITPKLGLDGTNFSTRAITPADNSPDVLTITGTGLWFMDAGNGLARLTSAGVGTATVFVSPAIG